jgi:cytochrome c peroxidase
VANLEMHGKGRFSDRRLNDASKFPVAAKNGFGNVVPPPCQPDLISSKLAALQAYQLSLRAPAPPAGSFNEQAAERGEELFNGKARCAFCHVPPTFSEPGWNLHAGAKNTVGLICLDDFQSKRAPDNGYRTSPLNGLWTHTKGGFYHDGRFATVGDVVRHYNSFFGLGLSDSQSHDLVEYLKSL